MSLLDLFNKFIPKSVIGSVFGVFVPVKRDIV